MTFPTSLQKFFIYPVALFFACCSSLLLATASTSTEDPVAVLSEYVRFPSISTQPEHAKDVVACANWLVKRFQAMGLACTLYPTKQHPIVIAKTSFDPKKRTVLIYGHYDVQPVDPISDWKRPPFEPYLDKKEGKLYGRGSADDKGASLAHILGVAETLKEKGTLPVNIIFLLEGEEEIGSPNLETFLQEHHQELACDVIVISDTLMAPGNYPAITYAMRGIAVMELILRGPKQDLHSGIFGGAVANPLAVAGSMVASLHDAKGHVLIPGFYDHVKLAAPWERENMKKLEASSGGDVSFKKLAGISDVFGEAGFTTLERRGMRPTVEVNGFGGGYQGAGSKTIIPKDAFVKLSFRLVPGQDPQHILLETSEYLKKQVPPGISLEIIIGECSGNPCELDIQSADQKAAQQALQEAFGSAPFFLREGGSIPIVATFKEVLGRDAILIGLDNPDCNMHSINENMSIDNLTRGIHMNQLLLEKLAK